MITYEELLQELTTHADEGYRAFMQKSIKDDNVHVLGVRTPVLRTIAKKYREEWRTIFSFPNNWYEVTIVKCGLAGYLTYPELCGQIDGLVAMLNNWATCDGLAPGCIAKHREEFLAYVDRYLADERVFVRRFALTTLLHFYVDEQFVPEVTSRLRRVRAEEYYVSMAAAWLAAEVIIKFRDAGVALLREHALDRTTHNRTIRKACESLRLSAGEKEELRALRRPVIQ